MVMEKERGEGESGDKGEAWRVLNQVLDLLDSKAKVCYILVLIIQKHSDINAITMLYNVHD